MTEKKKKSNKKPVSEKLAEKKGTNQNEIQDEDSFDYGGFPKDVSLKRNIGCGG